MRRDNTSLMLYNTLGRGREKREEREGREERRE